MSLTMTASAAAHLVLAGDDDWNLLAEDPAYDTKYGAAVRVLAQHVLAGSNLVEKLAEIERELDGSCCFEFCPGVDAPFQNMATCRSCSARQDLRVLIADREVDS